MTIMYLGPDLKGIVRHNQIFAYRPEKTIEQASEIAPLARHLFVSMEDIVKKKKELRRAGSFLYLVNKKVKEEVDHGRI